MGSKSFSSGFFGGAPWNSISPSGQGSTSILGTSPIDIAVFILWSRLGSPLGKSVLDREGKPSAPAPNGSSISMLAALSKPAAANGGTFSSLPAAQQRPDFKKKLAEERFRRDPRPAHPERAGPVLADPDTSKTRSATTPAPTTASIDPVGYAGRLKVHLRALIDQRIEAGEGQRAARWMEASLTAAWEVFRSASRGHLLRSRGRGLRHPETRLRQRETEGRAFVADLVGASGCRQILPGPRRSPGQPDPVQPGRIRPRVAHHRPPARPDRRQPTPRPRQCAARPGRLRSQRIRPSRSLRGISIHHRQDRPKTRSGPNNQ